MHKWLVTGRGSTVRGATHLWSAVATALLASLAASAQAGAAESPQPRVNAIEITPFGGYMAGGEFEDPGVAEDADSDREVEKDSDYGVIFNFNAEGPERQYEVLYAKQATVVEGATPLDMDIQYLQVGGIVNFTDHRHVVPFFGGTVGIAQFAPDAAGHSNEILFALTIGGGVKVPITDHIGVRLDTRAFVTMLDSGADLFCASSDETSGCRIGPKSSTFLQYSASLGIVIGF